jgi:transposase
LRVISGIAYVLRNELQWKNVPRKCGPHKTLYNRFVRWSRMCALAKILKKLAKLKTEVPMIDATHLKAHRTAASLKKWDLFHGASGGRREDLGASCTRFAMILEER